MTTGQHTIKPTKGSRKSIKRIGRGAHGGTYSGRGGKGQTARTGGGTRIGFEGGQTPLLRRMPKLKGFNNPNRVEYKAINLGRLNEVFNDGDVVNAESIKAKKLMSKIQPVKLLATGDLKKKLTITVDLASESAVKKVEKAGGTLKLLRSKPQA